MGKKDIVTYENFRKEFRQSYRPGINCTHMELWHAAVRHARGRQVRNRIAASRINLTPEEFRAAVNAGKRALGLKDKPFELLKQLVHSLAPAPR